MGDHENTKQQVMSGTCNANIAFDDLCTLLTKCGFKSRIKGSHQIFSRTGVMEIINLQPGRDGKAKAYQVRQVKGIFLRYGKELNL